MQPPQPPHPDPRCCACRYHLLDLPAGPCPECGAPFDPADPRTLYAPPATATALARARPPRWLLLTHTALAIPLIILSNSPTGTLCESVGLLWLMFFGIPILLWMLAVLAHLFARAELRLARAPQPPWSARWLATPALLAAAITLQSTSIIWKARWAIARPRLEAALKNNQLEPGFTAGFSIRLISRTTDGTATLMLGFPDSFYSDAPPTLIYAPDPYPWTHLNTRVTLTPHWHAWLDDS